MNIDRKTKHLHCKLTEFECILHSKSRVAHEVWSRCSWELWSLAPWCNWAVLIVYIYIYECIFLCFNWESGELSQPCIGCGPRDINHVSPKAPQTSGLRFGPVLGKVIGTGGQVRLQLGAWSVELMIRIESKESIASKYHGSTHDPHELHTLLNEDCMWRSGG